MAVGSQQVTLGNGGSQTATVILGPNFSDADAVHIDGSADFYGNDYPIKIDNVVLGGSQPITIPAGSDSGSIKVPVVNDSVYEAGETISDRLSSTNERTRCCSAARSRRVIKVPHVGSRQQARYDSRCFKGRQPQ